MSQINVRTATDHIIAEREKKLQQELESDAVNPFRTCFINFKVKASHLYRIVGGPGVLCAITLFWGYYPVFARFRHQHVKRYGRRQVDVRERLFHTKNITKVKDPAERRPGWRGWAAFFVFFRFFQDATDMPDMPRFPV